MLGSSASLRLLSILSVAFTVVRAASVAGAGPIIDLGYASYEGVYNATGDTTYFLGVRYAAPPVGKLRFQAPQPPQRMSGVQKANTEPATCWEAYEGQAATEPFTKRDSGVQLPPTAKVPSSEDCLFLNIWTPGKPDASAKRPVLVWIHGGGYSFGDMQQYNGWDMIRHGQHDLVVVELQYRLNAFGFMAGKDMKDKGVLNAGLLDQNLALQWIQKNIHLFGGDADKVTIWGESAGGGSVLQHMVAKGGKNPEKLFRAGVTSSVFLPWQYEPEHRINEEVYSAVADLTGCSKSKDIWDCLHTVDAKILSDAALNVTLSGLFGTWHFVPVVDGKFIVERPTITMNRGQANGEKLYAINTAFEGLIYVSHEAANGTLESYVKNFSPTLSHSEVDEVVKAYSNIGLKTTFDQAVGVMGEAYFTCPSYWLFNAFPNKAYRGWFAIPPGTHAMDLNYYFDDGTILDPRPYSNPQFIESFAQSVTDFAKTLDVNDHTDPNVITPHWDVWSKGHTEMLFNATELSPAGQPVIHPFATDEGLLQRCALWNKLAPSSMY